MTNDETREHKRNQRVQPPSTTAAMNLLVPIILLLLLASPISAFTAIARISSDSGKKSISNCLANPQHHRRQKQQRTHRQSVLKTMSPSSLPSSSTSSSSYSEKGTILDVSSYMLGPTPEETKDYIMQQTMLRVKDPKKSLDFYCNVLGFKLIHYSEVSRY